MYQGQLSQNVTSVKTTLNRRNTTTPYKKGQENKCMSIMLVKCHMT